MTKEERGPYRPSMLSAYDRMSAVTLSSAEYESLPEATRRTHSQVPKTGTWRGKFTGQNVIIQDERFYRVILADNVTSI